MKKKTFHKIIQHTGYTLAALLITLLLAAAGAAVWLWGWTWNGTPSFHESWTTDERKAITEFDSYLRQRYARDTVAAIKAVAWISSPVEDESFIHIDLQERLSAAYLARMVAAPVCRMLHRFAESGDASSAETISFQDIHGLTPAIIAAQTGHLKALEALVQHGANPNAIAYCADDYSAPMEVETPISPLLNGYFILGRKIPWNIRRQTAEFLLEHGGDLNVSCSINKFSCDMALMLHTPESTAPWTWALDHGMHMTAKNLSVIISFAEGRPLLERALRENLVDVNDTSSSQTILQSLMRVLLRPYDEKMWLEDQPESLMEAHLAMLLAAGADPSLIPKDAQPQRPGETEEEYEERLEYSQALQDTPLDIATKALQQAKLPAHRELCRRLIEKLKQAGAKTSAELRAEISH